jgi:hypothetical protein
MYNYDPDSASAPTQIIPVAAPPRRRKRWYQRWWAFRLPALLLAALIGITALGAAVGPAPAVKATIMKTVAAATSYCPAGRQETP